MSNSIYRIIFQRYKLQWKFTRKILLSSSFFHQKIIDYLLFFSHFSLIISYFNLIFMLSFFFHAFSFYSLMYFLSYAIVEFVSCWFLISTLFSLFLLFLYHTIIFQLFLLCFLSLMKRYVLIIFEWSLNFLFGKILFLIG